MIYFAESRFISICWGFYAKVNLCSQNEIGLCPHDLNEASESHETIGLGCPFPHEILKLFSSHVDKAYLLPGNLSIGLASTKCQGISIPKVWEMVRVKARPFKWCALDYTYNLKLNCSSYSWESWSRGSLKCLTLVRGPKCDRNWTGEGQTIQLICNKPIFDLEMRPLERQGLTANFSQQKVVWMPKKICCENDNKF